MLNTCGGNEEFTYILTNKVINIFLFISFVIKLNYVTHRLSQNVKGLFNVYDTKN